MASMQFRFIFISLLVGAVATASINPKELLWPLPQNCSFSSTPVMVKSSGFKFNGAGAGGQSTILKSAFSRYLNYLFDSGNSTGSGAISSLTVTVNSADESLGMDTSEKCESRLTWSRFGLGTRPSIHRHFWG